MLTSSGLHHSGSHATYDFGTLLVLKNSTSPVEGPKCTFAISLDSDRLKFSEVTTAFFNVSHRFYIT